MEILSLKLNQTEKLGEKIPQTFLDPVPGG